MRFFKTQNIEDFGVDINDLMKMQEQYHQLIEDTCGIQFKKNQMARGAESNSGIVRGIKKWMLRKMICEGFADGNIV